MCFQELVCVLIAVDEEIGMKEESQTTYISINDLPSVLVVLHVSHLSPWLWVIQTLRCPDPTWFWKLTHSRMWELCTAPHLSAISATNTSRFYGKQTAARNIVRMLNSGRSHLWSAVQLGLSVLDSLVAGFVPSRMHRESISCKMSR